MTELEAFVLRTLVMGHPVLSISWIGQAIYQGDYQSLSLHHHTAPPAPPSSPVSAGCIIQYLHSPLAFSSTNKIPFNEAPTVFANVGE